MKNLLKLMMMFTITLWLSSCNKDKNNPGYTFVPDMAYTTASKSYSASNVFANGLTMQAPPVGTIPRGASVYPYKAKSPDDQLKAGLELMNPIEASPANLAEGKRQYEIYCINCHGVGGNGDGYLYTSKLFPAKPRSLIEPFVQTKPDGEIFHIITVGSLSTLMGGHGSQIAPDNRWRIVNYVRTLAK
ncbi:MAG: c-type cytochrome [Bacteroidales bacterium]|nr:c-type cytochrome [Bacteroidales bacterium]